MALFTRYTRQLCARDFLFQLNYTCPSFAKRGNATGLSSQVKNTTVLPKEEIEWKSAKPFGEIPGLRSVPLFGTMWGMLPIVGYGFPLTKMEEYHMFLYNKFGPIWKDTFPGNLRLVTSTNPDDAEKVFGAEGRLPERPPLQSLKKYRDDRTEIYKNGGLFNSNGDDWYKSRSIVQQPFLRIDNIMNYTNVLDQVSQEFVDRIRLIRRPDNNEMGPDFINELSRWALEGVAVVAFDTRLGCLNPNLSPDSEAQRMINAARFSVSALAEIEFSVPIWKLYKTKKMRKLYENQDFAAKTAMKYMKQTIERSQQRPAHSKKDTSILEQILARGMSPEEAVTTVVDLLLAGSDSASNTVGFLLYHLARNPDKQQALRKEVLSVVGPKGTVITSSALNKLPYLRACIKESLRLNPPGGGTARVIDRDLILSGYRVPKGTLVLALHHINSKLEKYFADATKFAPERWIKGHPLEAHHNPYIVLPFGHGARSCVGRRFAELEMRLLVAKLIQNFEIEYHYEDIGNVFRLLNTPDKPLRFRFIDLK